MPLPSHRFRSLLWKTPVEREIEDELAFHLEMRERDYVARGMDPIAARAAARARLGALEPVRAECRRIGRRRDRALDRAESFAELRQDLRLAARRQLAAPVFAILSILTLALALAAATAAASAYDALALRPLPFPHPDRLVRLRESGPQGDDLAVSPSTYLAWLAAWRSLELGRAPTAPMTAMAALAPADRIVVLPGGRESVRGVAATASLFPLLGIRAARGRLLAAADESRGREHRVVVLSDRLWRRLGGGWDLVGQPLALDGLPYVILGVLPAGIAFPPGADLWTPLPLDLRRVRQGHDRHELAVVARLRPDVEPATAAGELTGLAGPAARAGPGAAPGLSRPGVRATPLARWVVGAEGRARALLALGAALLLALLAGCGVANLLISRAAARSRELALRAALGAGRGRILRQLATEGALLALLGAALALPLAAGILALARDRFAALSSSREGGFAASFAAARLAGVALDGRALGFLAALAAAAIVAIGLIPALAASRVELAGAARAASRRPPDERDIGVGGIRGGRGRRGSGRSRRLRDALVVTEIAAATVLLVGAGLAARSFLRLRAAAPGFAAERVLAAELALAGERYPPAARRALSRDLEARLARLPGVVAVGSTSFAPWSGERPDPPFLVTWRERGLAADLRSVTSGFFRAVGLPLVAGRLPAGEGALPEVAVDRSLARRWWPAGGGLGERVILGSPPRPFAVVGIVGELADVAPGAPPRPTVFIPYPRRPWRTLTLVVQTAGDPVRMAAAVRREIAAVAGDLPVVGIHPLARGRAAAVAGPWASLLLLALFATLALALAATGIYDLLASGVGERAPEIAVRMALGASPRGVLALVVRRGLLLAGLGLAAGLAAAAGVARSLPSLFYDTSPIDALTYAGTSLLLIAFGLLAGLTPARRAVRIAPAAALAGK